MTDTAERAPRGSSRAVPQTPEATVRNWRYILVMTVVRGLYMPGALAISFDHIVTAGHMLGLTGWQAYTTPAFLDGFALIGMLMRARTFHADVRRFGLWLQCGAGVGSLAANVTAGSTAGERMYGALVVAGLVVAELAGERLHAGRPAKASPKARRAPVDRAAAARKAAATRAANKAVQDAADAERARQRAETAERRRLAREVAGLEASYAGPAAPVSGPPAAEIGEAAAYL